MRLVEVRANQAFSLRELAKKAKVNWKTIHNIEKGKHRPNPITILKISDALGINYNIIDEFKGRKDFTIKVKSMNKTEFEQQYATDSGKTVEELRKLGFVVEVCTCEEDICKGWVYTPTTVEAVNFNTDYENRYINKFFDGKGVYRSLKGTHYHYNRGCYLVGESLEYQLLTYSISDRLYSEEGKTYSPCMCSRAYFRKEFCCNKWWDSLTEDQKMYAHYHFHGMNSLVSSDRLKRVDMELLHEGIKDL